MINGIVNSKYFLMVLIAMVAFSFGMTVQRCPALPPVEVSCPEPYCPQASLYCPQPSCPQTTCQNIDYFEMKKVCESSFVYDISELQRIASSEPLITEYSAEHNCEYFSNVLIARLKRTGYAAQYCTGTYDGENHAWIKVDRVYIEATTGRILSVKEFNDNYKLNACNDKEVDMWN
jgi:hypothetical protein